jgi:hypothetical protein
MDITNDIGLLIAPARLQAIHASHAERARSLRRVSVAMRAMSALCALFGVLLGFHEGAQLELQHYNPLLALSAAPVLLWLAVALWLGQAVLRKEARNAVADANLAEEIVLERLRLHTRQRAFTP